MAQINAIGALCIGAIRCCVSSKASAGGWEEDLVPQLLAFSRGRMDNVALVLASLLLHLASGAVLGGGLPSARSLQQLNGFNVTTLLCPQGTFISAVRGLANLQLQALEIGCGPVSQGNFTATWGAWSLLGPQPLGTVLWAYSDPRPPMPPLIFWFKCDGGFDALRQTPTGAGTSGSASTLSWHCSSDGQWTYPNVARATLSPPTDVSNCTAFNNSTGLQGQQLRMVGISLAWQPAANGVPVLVDILPVCDWVDVRLVAAPAAAPQLPEGAVALPVLTSSLYDSYPENVGNLPTPVLCPAGEYVVGITAWTTFVFSTMQLICSGGTTLAPIGTYSLQQRNIPCKESTTRYAQGDKWLSWCSQGIQSISFDWSSSRPGPMRGFQTMCHGSTRWGPWSAFWENLGSFSQSTQPKLGTYPAYTCPAGMRLIGVQAKVSQRVDLTAPPLTFGRLSINNAALTYAWSVISALGAVCGPFPEALASPAAQQSLGLNTPASMWGLPNGTAPTGYNLGSMGVPAATSQAEQALSALSPAPQPTSVTQGGTNSSSSTSSFTSAMVCSGSGSYVQSISFIFSQLPRLPWLVTCSGGEEHLVGLPPGGDTTAAASAATLTLSSPTCDMRAAVDHTAYELSHAFTCAVGIDGMWFLQSASGDLAPLQLAFKCRHNGLYPLVLGNAWTAPSVSSFKACPPGQVISGISVAAGPFQLDPALTVVNGIAFECSTPVLPTSLSLPLQTPPPGATVLPAFGRNLPDSQPYAMPFSLSCLPGAWVSAVYGLANQVVGTMSVTCSGPQPRTSVGPVGYILNTTYWQSYSLECPGGFTAVKATDDGSLRSINKLNLFCGGSTQGWAQSDGVGAESDTNIAYVNKTATTTYTCPASQKIVGLRGIISYYEGDPAAELAITQLQAVCADPSAVPPLVAPTSSPSHSQEGVDGTPGGSGDPDAVGTRQPGQPSGTAHSSGGSGSSTTAVAAGCAVGGAALVAVCVAAWVLWARRQRQLKYAAAQASFPPLKGEAALVPLYSINSTSCHEGGNGDELSHPGDGSSHPPGHLGGLVGVPSSSYPSSGTLMGTSSVNAILEEGNGNNGQSSPQHGGQPRQPGSSRMMISSLMNQQQSAPTSHPGPVPATYLPNSSQVSALLASGAVVTVQDLVWVQPGLLDAQQQQVQETAGGLPSVCVDAQRLLGTGCHGWVYEGRMRGAPVAVKLLVSPGEDSAAINTVTPPPASPPLSAVSVTDAAPPQHIKQPAAQGHPAAAAAAAQVQQEVAALCRLKHPAIVRLLGISKGLTAPTSPRGQEPPRPGPGGQQSSDKRAAAFLVYELVNGGTLATAIYQQAAAGPTPEHDSEGSTGQAAQHALALGDVLAAAASIADALAYMCGQGWVHKDVKPSNILVPLLDGQEHQGQQHRGGPPPLAFHAAKLADFGLAAPVAPRPVARVALPSPFAAGRPLIPPSPFAASGPQTGSSGQGAPASSGPSTPALGGGGGGAGGGSSWRGSQGLGSLLDTHSRASSISAGGKGPPSDDAVHMTQHHVPVLAPPQQQFHRLSVTSSFARPSGGLSSVGHADAGAVADHGTVASAGPSHNGSVTMDPSEGFGVAGTVAYAAPEVLDPGRGPVTPAADVWSLGVVMWECLTGQRPWQGHTSGAIMTAVAIQGRHLPVPEGDSERFPPGVTTLLEGCWATDAGSRLTASEVAARCRELLGQLSGTHGRGLGE